MSSVAPRTDTVNPINVEPERNGIRIDWPDRHQSFFHHVWLRDCCYCEICGQLFQQTLSQTE